MGNKTLDSQTTQPKETYSLVNIATNLLTREEKNFILGSFKASLISGNEWFKLIWRDHFNEAYTKYIETLFEKPCTCRMALLDDKTIAGWSLFEGKTLHYVFVRYKLARQGIGQMLLPKGFDTVTHMTHKGINIWTKHYQEVRFEPFV